MRGRLKGWQRTGIVLSVLWAIFGGWWGNAHIVSPMKDEMNRCLVLHPANSDEVNCRKLYVPRVVESKYITLAIALIPIPVAWLLVYIVVGAARWIRRGLQSIGGSGGLT